MAGITKENFFKHLDGLTVLELADYIKECGHKGSV